jgi:hypothetical protein
LLDVDERYGKSILREDVRDAVAHRAAADDGDVFRCSHCQL